MILMKLREEELKREYGILCQRFLPTETVPGAPFGATWCVVEPGGSTQAHDHFEGETFFFLEGRGRMEIDGERREVGQGDLVYIPPFSRHVLQNASVTEKLVLLSLWWEPGAQLEERLPRRVLVASAPPTPNGDLHLGHLSGPYLAADVLGRYLAMRGVEVLTLSGADDHQSYVAAKARALGLTPEATVARFASSIEHTLASFDAAPDYFLRPDKDPGYRAFVREFFQKLVDNGSLVKRESEALHCETCDRYLYEVHVSGRCPHCDAPTNGNGCERCGKPNDCVNLVEPRCNGCRRPAGRRAHTRFHFALEPWRERLTAFWREVEMSPSLRAVLSDASESALPDISATHVADWGIPCPVPGFEGQVIYEWVEMAAGYLYSAERIAGDARRLWKADDAAVVQCFGFDNGFFYAALLPALLLAYDPGIRLPRTFVTNEFYRLDGEKFSTSRNHAIWGDDLLAVVPSDVVRLYLAYDRPEAEQTNFTLSGFQAFVARELAGEWEPWLRSLDERLAMQGGVRGARRSPEFCARSLTTRGQAFLDRLNRIARDTAEAYSPRTFSLGTVARRLCALVTEAREFSKAHAAIRHCPSLEGEARNALALELAAARLLGLLASPLMPGLGEHLRVAFGGKRLEWEQGLVLVPAGTELGELGTSELSRALSGLEGFARGKS